MYENDWKIPNVKCVSFFFYLPVCVTTFTVTLDYHCDSDYVIACIFIIFSQLFGIILTSVLLYLYNSRYTPYEANNDDVVYEMARCQEKSPYPTRGTGPYANLYTN